MVLKSAVGGKMFLDYFQLGLEKFKLFESVDRPNTTHNSGGTRVFINSFYNLKYALPHNYVITKFTGYARVLNYLDSGKNGLDSKWN